MQIRRIGYRIRGFLRAADRGLYWDMICKSAEQRLNVLRFWERHGLAAAQEAFGVSRRTLFAWQAQLRRGKGKPHTLTPGSTRPHRLRRRSWPLAVIEEIRRLRCAHPNLGKERLYRFVKAFCLRRNLPIPSVRTIGRQIADAPDRCAMRSCVSRAFPRAASNAALESASPRGIVPKALGTVSPGTALSGASTASGAT